MSNHSNGYFVATDQFLLAIIGHCATDISFLKSCMKSLSSNEIPAQKESVAVKRIYETLISYVEKYDHLPNEITIMNECSKKWPDAQEYSAILSAYKRSLLIMEQFPKAYVSDNLVGWGRFRVLHKGLEAAAGLFRSGDYTKVEQRLTKIIKTDLKEIEFGSGEFADIKSPLSLVLEKENSSRTAATLGHPDFDRAVYPPSVWGRGPETLRPDELTDLNKATSGSLLPGEITVVIGPSNSGKTTFISTVIASNITMGRKICLVTHEESEREMILKVFKSFIQIDDAGISANLNDPKLAGLQSLWRQKTDGKFFLREWIKPGKMYCEDVIDSIESQHEALVASTGKGFDLVIVDYPAKTGSRSKQFKNTFEEASYVYEQYRLLARKHQFHCLAPVQANRGAYQINKLGAGTLDMDGIAGGFGIGTNADNIISINRSQADLSGHSIKFYIAKCRQGQKGQTFISETNYSIARTHGADFGCYLASPAETAVLDDAFVSQKLRSTGRPRSKDNLISSNKEQEAKDFKSFIKN